MACQKKRKQLLITSFVYFLFPSVDSFLVPSIPVQASKTSSIMLSSISSTLTPELIIPLAMAAFLGTFIDPFVEQLYNVKTKHTKEYDFKDTFIFGAASSIRNASWVYGILIIVDLLANILGFQLPIENLSSSSALPVSLTIWALQTVSVAKKSIFLSAVFGNHLGRVVLYDRLFDFVIVIIGLVLILDECQIDFGMGFQSLLAGSGVGAVAFSLASKDLASHIVGGFIIQTWDAFEVGEIVKLGDGTEGTVKKIGLVETEILGYDSIAIKIPNSQLTNQRVANLSRIEVSQVLQTLRFTYSDLDKVPGVLEDIKEEIRKSCPKLIVDNSKPFQALLSSYKEDHVEAVINTNFHIPPTSADYAENRQQVLLAIARSLAKNEIKVALPSIYYESSRAPITDISD